MRSWRMREIRNRYLARSRPDSCPHDRRLGAARGADRLVDVGRRRAGDRGERLLRRRIDRGERAAAGRRHVAPVDEQAVALLERDDVARLGRGRVLPRDRLTVAEPPAVAAAGRGRDDARAAALGHARHYGTALPERPLSSRYIASGYDLLAVADVEMVVVTGVPAGQAFADQHRVVEVDELDVAGAAARIARTSARVAARS